MPLSVVNGMPSSRAAKQVRSTVVDVADIDSE